MLRPQQETVPSSNIAQVCCLPAEMETAVRPSPRELVCAGVVSDVVMGPYPSCPSIFDPQQETDPSSNIAQVWDGPAVMETAVYLIQGMRSVSGYSCPSLSSSPRFPLWLFPQHATDPSSNIAQVWSPPAEMETAVRPAPSEAV